MKHIPLPLALALLLAGAPPAAQAVDLVQARSGTVKMVNGEVSLVGAQGKRGLKSGDTVAVADTVVTGANGAASLVLRDGTLLMLGPDSRLEIKGFAYDATTQNGNLFLSMLRGSMRMITGLIGKAHPEAVKINTPTSIVGVLGTDFIIKAEGDAI